MRFLAIVACLLLAGLGSLRAQNPDSNYERDLAEINRRLAEPPADHPNASAAMVGATMLAEKGFLTEAPSDLKRACAAVEGVLAQAEPAPPFVALHAKLLLALHYGRAAEAEVSRLENFAPLYPELSGLRADLAIEAGAFEQARSICEAALSKRREWPMLARLAQVNTLLGREAAADSLYLEAEDGLTVKQMRVFAWLEVQRGRVAAGRGKWDVAQQRYARAEQAYSGLWLVEAALAEAAGAQGNYVLGTALYEKLADRTGRPEIFQALGDLYRYEGNPAQAKVWHERALAGYRASADHSEVLYLHHLAEFYADVRGNGDAALEWARRDFEIRPGVRTRQTLAWALYRAGAIEDALAEITTVLSSGLQNAHLFDQAARVNQAAGREEEARRLRAKAVSLNPKYEGFHVHS